MTRLGPILALGAALAVSGCCGDDSDNAPPNSLSIVNDTPYFLHILQPNHTRLYLAPGETDADGWFGQTPVTIVVAAGQDATGEVLWSAPACCGTACGTLTVTWAAGALVLDDQPPPCDAGVAGGSCPYVYSFDGREWRREAEMLVGALNRGAQREDGLVVARGQASGDEVRVRVATELAETSFIDRARLELHDHAPEIEVALDGRGRVVPVRAAAAAIAVTDGRGAPSGFAASADELAAATAADAGTYRLTRVVELAPVAGEPVLLLELQNGEFLQDTYHSYMQQFGPGVPKLMRFMSESLGYRLALQYFLEEAGFALAVEVESGAGYRPVTAVAPVGVAGPKTVAVPLPAPRPGALATRVRLRLLPEAWIVHSVRLGERAAPMPAPQVVAPTAATFGRGAGAARALPTETLGQVDNRYVAITRGERLELAFPAAPARAALRRTAVLRLTGFYEELDRARLPCIRLGVLNRCLRDEHAFARFALARLKGRGAAPGRPRAPAAGPP